MSSIILCTPTRQTLEDASLKIPQRFYDDAILIYSLSNLSFPWPSIASPLYDAQCLFMCSTPTLRIVIIFLFLWVLAFTALG